MNVNTFGAMDLSFSNNTSNATPGESTQQVGTQQRQASSNIAQAPPYLTNFGHQSLV